MCRKSKHIHDLYQGCKIVVRSASGETNILGVEVGLHQGTVLSPYLFLTHDGYVDRGCEKGCTSIDDVRRRHCAVLK